MKRWQKGLLIIVVLLCYGTYKILLAQGEFLHVQGQILIPLKQTEGPVSVSDGVYIITLDGTKKRELFFQDKGWGGYAFPWVQDHRFFCVGYRYHEDRSLQSHISRFYMVEQMRRTENAATVLMETPGMIFNPAITKDMRLVYYRREDEKLYCFDRKTGKESQIDGDKLVKDSSILVADDGAVIYCVEADYALVKRMPDGKKEILLQGAWRPLWYEQGKSILYVLIRKDLSSERRLYRLADKSSVKISDYTYTARALSPDKQCLAYTASGYWDPADTVCVVSMDGREERTFGSFPWESTRDAGSLCWLNDADFADSEIQ